MEIEKTPATAATLHTVSLRSRVSQLLLVVIAATLLVALNLPYQYESASQQATSLTHEGDAEVRADDLPMPVLAGWPLRYYQRVEYAGAPAISYWSTQRLLINIALSCVAFAMVVGYQVFSQRRLKRAAGQRTRMSVLDIMVIAVVLAIPLGYWRYMANTAAADLQLAQQIAGNGAYWREATLPRWLIHRVPWPLMQTGARTTRVRLDNPSDALVQSVLQNPHLRSLRIGGGTYDLRLLDELPRLSMLNDVAVEGRSIDARTIQMLGQIRSLRSLGLRRTNVSAESLQLLNSLPRLRRLDLRGSGIRLEDIQYAAWAERIEHLSLPRPAAGSSATVTLKGWPSLQLLQCAELDARPNPQPVQLVLADLPRLETIELDLLQKFAIDGRSLPQLQKIAMNHFKLPQRIRASERVAGGVWLSSLQLIDVPRLELLDCYGSDLEELSIRGAAKQFSLGIGVYTWDGNGQPRYDEDIPRTVRQRWIDGIGQSNCIDLADLSAIPLAGVDLRPLRQNPSLRRLNLSQSGTGIKEWRGLAGMKQLQFFNVRDCELDGRAVETLVRQLPALRVLECDGFGIDRLRLEHAPNLARLDFGDGGGPSLQALRLVDLPQLTNAFELTPWAVYLHLENVPSLQGLVIPGPLPPGAVLSGFRDLQTFAAGGAAVDDDVAEQLLPCQGLQQLMLAYTAVSPEMLVALGNLPAINLIDLTGSEVTDHVLSDWTRLDQLQTLRLDDTAVTGRCIQAIMKHSQWKELSLGGITAEEADLQGIEKLQGLTTLRVADWQLSSAMLAKIAALPRLQSLDLSNCRLDAEMLAAIDAAEPKQLTKLILAGCTLDSPGLIALARSRPAIMFDLTGADVSADAEVMLAGADRVLNMDEQFDGIPAALRAQIARMTNGQMTLPDPADAPPVFDARAFAPQDPRSSDSPTPADAEVTL